MVFSRTQHIRVPSLVRKTIRPPNYAVGPSRLFQALPSLETKFSLTAQRVLFTYARLLCSSSCYIAGLAFYNALNSLLTDSTSGLTIMMGVTDTTDQSATTTAKNAAKQQQAEQHVHNALLRWLFQPIVIRWTISILVMTLVILFVKSLVHFTEKQFVDQVRKENLVLRKQMLEEKLKVQSSIEGTSSLLNTAACCPLCGSGRDFCEKHMTPAGSPYVSPATSPPLDSMHRTNSLEEVKLQPSALFRHPTDANPIMGTGNADSTAKQLDTVAKRREYMQEWRSARRNLYRQKPLFVYRLADMLAYYLVFVAVYSLQSTLQLSLPMNSVGLQWIYLLIVAVCSYTAGNFLTLKNRTYVERLTHSTTCDEHDRLRVKQGIQRKLSSYTASSLSYLLAYAAWNAIQATLIAHSTKHTRQHFWFVWLLTLCVLLFGTAIVVLLNVRIHSEVLPDETTTGMRVVRSVFGLVSHMCCAACNPFARPISTSRLHVRVDILEGSTIHTPSQQLGTEGMSYIAALSLGASVAAVLPIAPLDDSTYAHTPTLHGLAVYAISISVVAAVSTAVLETLLTRLTTRHQDETHQAIKILTSSKSDDSLQARKSESPELYDDEQDADNTHNSTSEPKLRTNTQPAPTAKTTAKPDPKKIKQEYLEALTDDEYGDEDAEDEEEENALSEVEVEEEEQKRIYHSKVNSGATPPQAALHHPAPLQLYTSPRFRSTSGSNAVLDTIITIKATPHHDTVNNNKEPNSGKSRHKSNVSISIDLQPLDMKRSISGSTPLQQFSKPPKSPSIPTHAQIFPPNKASASAKQSPATTAAGSSSRATTTSSMSSPLLPPTASPSITTSPEPLSTVISITPHTERLLPWQHAPSVSTDDCVSDMSASPLPAEPVLLLALPAAPSSYGSVEGSSTVIPIYAGDTVDGEHETDGLLAAEVPMTRRDTQHRLLLARTFIHEWYVALVGTFVQGLSLMCAYGWVGLLYFGVLPSVGLDTSTQTTAWVFAVGSFASYAAMTALTAKFFAT